MIFDDQEGWPLYYRVFDMLLVVPHLLFIAITTIVDCGNKLTAGGYTTLLFIELFLPIGFSHAPSVLFEIRSGIVRKGSFKGCFSPPIWTDMNGYERIILYVKWHIICKGMSCIHPTCFESNSCWLTSLHIFDCLTMGLFWMANGWNCVWLVRFKRWNHPTRSTVPQWLVVWNMFLCFHILGISSSQLTHIFQRGRYTTNQPMSCYYGAFQPCRWEELRNLILQRPLVTLHETRNFTKSTRHMTHLLGPQI